MRASPKADGSDDRDIALIDAALRDASSIKAHGGAVLELEFDRAVGKPESIPGYQIRDEIHSGAQSIVYRAIQTGTNREVAIKVLRSGPFAHARARARFDREIHILAQLQHPNIITVHDSGTTADCVYFVMDYVDGPPLDEFAAGRPLREILELFAKVCDAVNAAHLHGVIHRDLKPGNIRVTSDGQPRVLDFGLAKLTDRASDEAALSLSSSEPGRFVGSLPWASPEQIEARPGGIDLRTDVYSLGVILYQLLTGRLPYESAGNARDLIDRILTAEPARPSSALWHRPSRPLWHRRPAGETKSLWPRPLRFVPSWLRASVPSSAIDSEIDTIVLKCQSKDPVRRYQSAGELARDVRLYLAGEPIEAKRDSPTYVLRKLLSKHKLSVAVVAAFVLVVTGGFVTSLAFWRQSVAKGIVADQRRVEAETERERADKEKAIAKAVNDFLTEDLLAAVAPSADFGKGIDVLMRDVLDKAAERIEEASGVGGRFEEMPLVEASIRATLDSTYEKLGEYAAAEPHLVQARLLRRRELGEEHPDTLASMNGLATLYWRQGRYDLAEPLAVKTLEIRLRLQGNEHPATLASTNTLAIIYVDQSRYAAAEPLFFRALEIQERVHGEEHPSTLHAVNNLAHLYDAQGRHDKAEPMYLETLETRRRVLGDEHPDTLDSMNNLAVLYYNQARYVEAEPLFRETLEIRERILGEEHQHTLRIRNNLAGLYQVQGRYAEAEPLFFRVMEIYKRVLTEEHPDTLASMLNFSIVYNSQRRYDKAEPLLIKTLELMTRVHTEEHRNTLSCMNSLAVLYSRTGRDDEAESLYVRTLEIRTRVLSKEHPETLSSMLNLALLYSKQGRHDEAESLLVKTLEIQKRVRGEEHPDTLDGMNALATLYGKQGRMDDARPLVRALQEIERRRADRPEASPSTKNAFAWNLLTCEPADLRDPDTALRLAREACTMTNNANPALLDTLALAQHLTGDTPAAIETEKTALSLLSPDAPGRGDYEAALAKFEAALKEPNTAEPPGGG